MPQPTTHRLMDGLLERFDQTLTEDSTERREELGQMPTYVLFAYRTSPQESTKESPLYLLYGRQAKLPTEAALKPD